MKKIAVCGASGLVGSRLVRQLHQRSFPLVLVGRKAQPLQEKFPFAIAHYSWSEFAATPADDLGTIINLAGAGVTDKAWSEAYKQIMIDSRLNATQTCVELCQKNPSIRLINASAISAYGFYDDDHEVFAEADTERRTGTCFLQELIDRWEQATVPAVKAGSSVALLRIGTVFDRQGGALSTIEIPFRYFLGGRFGTGKQIMSWVSLEDLVAAIEFIFDRPDLNGPINLVSPGACSNRMVARSLGKAMGRPSLIPIPAFLIRAMMGQMGQELVLWGQRASPSKLLAAGFVFQDQDIDAYFQKTFRR